MSRADAFPLLPDDQLTRWKGYGQWDKTYYPQLIGLWVEDVRAGWCRMRLPWRFELTQPAGVVHGGAMASLIDSVVVPAIGSTVVEGSNFVTIDLHVQYHGAVVQEDMVAEGWITSRGRSTVFCEAEVTTDKRGVVARGFMTYKVQPPRG